MSDKRRPTMCNDDDTSCLFPLHSAIVFRVRRIRNMPHVRQRLPSFMSYVVCLIFLFRTMRGRPDTDASETDLRKLLLDDPNQELIDHLGTRYEIVYPQQIRKDWRDSGGLSTRLSSINGTITHVQETTLLIETFEHKLQLDLELNTQLFAPTLVQLMYLKSESPITTQKLPENCYYHAKVRNYPHAKAAFQTCNGIKGIIYLKEKTYFIHPLYGDHLGKQPHLLYHYFPEEDLACGAVGELESDEETEDLKNDDWHRRKYIELALVLDQSLVRKFKSLPTDAVSSAIEIINYVDMLYRPLNTSVSLVYLELWIEDQMLVLNSNHSATATLERFKEYATQRIGRISADAVHLITSVDFEPKSSGVALIDSICTNDAVGLTRMEDIFQPHTTAFVMAHMLGHNLGMNHDHSGCECPEISGCVMNNKISISAYKRTQSKGYGACLYNMPTMRTSICGNGILEEPEQCDCGTTEECAKSDPCCDPITCRLIKHAQCSKGPCCRKCKLLSTDYLCRPSRGECDIPEFCDGLNGKCPTDLFKRNGAVCSEGLGYCYQGSCPVLKHQCEDVWGEDTEAADSICFERLNVLGTPNGNCGTDDKGEIAKCGYQNAHCGSLQCSHGEKSPLPSHSQPPIHFVKHKINHLGTVYECKTRTFPTSYLREGLVKDGTKCGYQKLCINQTCISLKTIVSGKCPNEDGQGFCSGHGMCTNINSCFCDEGWKGLDCSVVDEDVGQISDYYDAVGGYSENTHYGQSEMRMNPNLAITVIVASIVIGVGLVIIVVLIFFYRH